MTLDLVRERCTADRVDGRMSIDGVFQCYTLEPARRAENPTLAFPAIPSGRYRVTVAFSPKFQQMVPHVHDVPGRQNIEIHVGNFAATDTHGCILVGSQRSNAGILHSRDAFHNLMVSLAQVLSRGGKVELVIEDPFQGEMKA